MPDVSIEDILSPEVLKCLDRFIGEEKDLPNRSEAIRRILEDWLKGHGYMEVEK